MIRYEIREGKDGIGSLQVRIVGKGVNTKVSTGIKVKMKEWCADAQTLKHASDVRPVAMLGGLSYHDMSERLSELRRVLAVMDERGEATSENVKRMITDIVKEKSCVNIVDTRRGCFVRFIDLYIQEMENGTRTKNKTHQKVRSYYPKMYKTLKKKIEAYEKARGVDIGWGSLTKTFFDKFCVYLHEDEGLKQNSIALHARLLSIVVKEAIRRKLVTCETDIQEWSIRQTQTDKVSLSERQLEDLYEMDFTNMVHVQMLIEKAKDEDKEFVKYHTSTRFKRNLLQKSANVFLLCCFTGQRFSDYLRMTPDVICQLSDGRDYIKIKQQKTGKDLYIPLDPRAAVVMRRDIVKMGSSKINEDIKRIGRVMGWTDLTGFTEEKNGIKYPSQKKFYEYLESHTARRTFASLMYKRGVNIEAIMAVTGHATEQMLRRYIRVDEEEKAMMASREMFKISIVKKA